MLTLSNPAQLGTLIAPTMNRQEARQALFRNGWKFLDGGSFSSVWLAPDGSRVIKVTKEDAGSRATVEASFACPSRHLPQVYAVVELANGGFAVEVERLRPASYDSYRDVQSMLRLLRTTNDVTGATPELVQAFEALRPYVDEETIDWDIHSGNVMFRREGDEDVLVLTDVLYWCKYKFNGTAHDAATVAKSCEEDPLIRLMEPVYDKAEIEELARELAA